VVEYLFEQHVLESHLQYRNNSGENVLHLAARLCNPDMSRHLMPVSKTVYTR
jgi:hypothetical protein